MQTGSFALTPTHLSLLVLHWGLILPVSQWPCWTSFSLPASTCPQAWWAQTLVSVVVQAKRALTLTLGPISGTARCLFFTDIIVMVRWRVLSCRRRSWRRCDCWLTQEMDPGKWRLLRALLSLECMLCPPFLSPELLQGHSLKRVKCSWDHLNPNKASI